MRRVVEFRVEGLGLRFQGPEVKNTFVESRARMGDPGSPSVEGPRDPSFLGSAWEERRGGL